MARFGRGNDQIGIGIDIGTSKVAVTIGQIREGLISVLAIGSAPNSGLRRGYYRFRQVVSSLSMPSKTHIVNRHCYWPRHG